MRTDQLGTVNTDDVISEQCVPIMRTDRDMDDALSKYQNLEAEICLHVMTRKELTKEKHLILFKVFIWSVLAYLHGLAINTLAKGNLTAQAAAFVLKQGAVLDRRKVLYKRVDAVVEKLQYHESEISACCYERIKTKSLVMTYANHGIVPKTAIARDILDHMI